MEGRRVVSFGVFNVLQNTLALPPSLFFLSRLPLSPPNRCPVFVWTSSLGASSCAVHRKGTRPVAVSILDHAVVQAVYSESLLFMQNARACYDLVLVSEMIFLPIGWCRRCRQPLTEQHMCSPSERPTCTCTHHFSVRGRRRLELAAPYYKGHTYARGARSAWVFPARLPVRGFYVPALQGPCPHWRTTIFDGADPHYGLS